MARMMMECLSCGSRRFLDSSPAQASDMEAAGTTWMACEKCQRDTDWKFADVGRQTGVDRRMNVAVDKPQTVNGPRVSALVSPPPAPEKGMYRQGASAVFLPNRRFQPDRREGDWRKNVRVAAQVPICVRYGSEEARAATLSGAVREPIFCCSVFFIASMAAADPGQPAL